MKGANDGSRNEDAERIGNTGTDSPACDSPGDDGHHVRPLPRGQRHEAGTVAETLPGGRIGTDDLPPFGEHHVVPLGIKHRFGPEAVVRQPEV